MSPAAHNVIQRLDAARQKWWLFTLLSTVVLAICASFSTLLLFMLIDALWKFAQWMLAGSLVVWAGVTIALLVLVVRRLMRGQRSLEATARCVEAEIPELGSDLINVVQLSSDTQNVNRPFCEAAVTEAASRLGQTRFEEAAAKESRWRRFRFCMQTPRDFAESVAMLGTLVALAILCQMLIPNWGSAANRLMEPWKFVPSVGKVQIKNVKPGNAEIMVGGALDVTAEVTAPEKKAYKATIFVTAEGEKKETAMPMTVDKGFLKYSLSIPSVSKPLRYRLEIGDSQSDVYSIGLREKPAIQEIQVTFTYPAYLSRKKDTFAQKQGDLEAPQYTVAELLVRPSVPIAKGHVQLGEERFVGHIDSTGALSVKFPLLKDGAYTIQLFDSIGHTDPDPRVNRIHVVPDHPPTVELLKPTRQETAAPGASIPVSIRATDDHILGRVRLEMKVKRTDVDPQAAGAPAESAGPEEKAAEANPDEAKPADSKPAAAKASNRDEGEVLPLATVQEWTKFDGNSTILLQHRLELPADKIKDGHTVLVRAVAWDTRDISDWGLDLKAQETASPWASIRIVAEEKKAAAALEQIDSLKSAIWKILENQLRARHRASTILHEKEAPEATKIAGDVRTGQIDIQKSSADLVKSIGATDKEDRAAIKRVLNQLAFNEMLEAVQQSDELAKIKDLAGFAQPVPKLNTLQDRIVDTLKKLLDATRQSQLETLTEMKKRPGADMPDDLKKKFEEARNKLEKFLEQQKKVIEATENLAKKPVEDFSEEEDQLLKKLAAAEDDLAKFMKELQTDLSKLPEQDFANASMAKELNEIQTELKMAEDALLKKSADIAVPLEQLGYERAESMTSNFEKWLPDTPDREKWSQEESLSDKDKEAPMAELPGELEDLIGDLMEQEEDIFDEAEDVSSSAIDSPDKGVAWDAADGPISSNSAKGVTGNRLPGTNEIGGRSGEGRSGKSSGEFVGDEAVGKGGRKTPSRLTPDPIMKGQIKDHEKDGAGGASGGGKESGEGGEGLEGPAPNSPGKRDHNRLAGKQAALRNKAEAVDLQQFKVAGYHHQDLTKMIDLMKQIEIDLKSGRYQNVLREKKVMLQGLGNVKQYLKGDFEVRKDATVNLPTDIQKEILGSMQDPSPAGWEDFNRQYFEALANGGDQAGAAPAAPAPEKK